MADDLVLNSGSGGETVATDQAAGGEHYQVVKLADGTADSTTHIPLSGDLTNGLDVDVTRVGGTVTVDLGANNDVTVTSGTVTETNSTAILADTAAIDTATAAINAKLVTGTVIGDVNLAATEASNLADIDTAVTAMNAKFVSGTDIGDVDVTSVVPGTAATNLGKAIQSAQGATDTGVAALAVRNDTLADLAGTDGDYAPLQVTATGALYVEVDNITSEVTFDTTTYSTGVTTGLMSGAVRNDTLGALAGTDNDVAPLQVNATGALYTDGSGFTQPVSGTVTANPASGTIDTVTTVGSVTTCNLAAETTKVIGTVNVAAGQTIAATNAGTFTIQEDGAALTSLQLLDDAVHAEAGALSKGLLIALDDGTDAQFAQANASGHLKVDIATDTVGIGGGTQYTEDAPSAADPVGNAQILKRLDTPALIGVDDDNVARRGTGYGAAYTQIVDSSGNFVDTFGGSGGTAMADDGAFTAGTTQGTPAFAMWDDTTPTSIVTDNDAGILRMSQNRNLYSQIRDAAGNERGVNVNASNELTVKATDSDALLTTIDADTSTLAGAVAAGQMQVDIVADGAGLLTTSAHDAAFGTAGTADAQVRSVQGIAGGTALPVSGTVTANPASGTIDTVTTVGSVTTCNLAAETTKVIGTVNLSATDNTVLDNIQTSVDTVAAAVSTEMQVDIVGSLPAGTAAIGKLAPNSGIDIGDVDVLSLPASTNTLEVVGDAAHDAAVAGNPLLVGMESRTTEPTAVGDGDACRAMATSLGKQVTYQYAIPAKSWSYASAAAVADTADDAAKAAGGAGVRNYVTGVQVFNGSDTVGTEVVIKDGSTVLWRGWAEETGGGCSARFDPPLRGTANTAINVANITTSSSTYFNLQGFQSVE